MRRALPLLFLAACTQSEGPGVVQVAATAIARDARSVDVELTHAIATIDQEAITAFAPFTRPIAELAIEAVEVDGPKLRIETGLQKGGTTYALTLGSPTFVGVEDADAPSQINFVGFGTTQVMISLDARGSVTPTAIEALVTIDPATGAYSDELARVPLVEGPSQVYSATITAQIEADRRYGARAVGSDGQPAAQLSLFTVASEDPVHVGLTAVLPKVPEFSAPSDPTPGNGRAPVRIIFDDRLARALIDPELKVSLDGSGNFDPASRVVPMIPVAGKRRVYEVVLDVAVDPNRTLEGTGLDDFPYVAFLVMDGEDLAQRGTTFEMKTETPQVIVIPIGNPALVPVTFRADVGSAPLELDNSLKGLFDGEGIFLTGELPSAEDALGRLAADAFTGGERATLEMNERPDAPGIYEKTIFLPKNRPYSWKVVRCPSGVGCAELNRHVLSSGRAFPTVMKNLVTANVDAAGSEAVRLIDPAHLDRVELEDGSFVSYAGARVSNLGTEAPSPTIMFKQEAPDLVVTVGIEPVFVPTVIVGTWRDVNIPQRPSEIIASGANLDLSPFDYDDGTQGRLPQNRDLELPIDPIGPTTRPGEPRYDGGDGNLDAASARILNGTLGLSLGWNERELYVATEPGTPDDRFVIISFDPPGATRAAHWAKSGQVSAGARQVFLANEGGGGFSGWFRYGPNVAGDVELAAGVIKRSGAVLEGTIDPAIAGIGALSDRIWVAVVAYQSADGGQLTAQAPMGNSNLDVEASEFREVLLSEIR